MVEHQTGEMYYAVFHKVQSLDLFFYMMYVNASGKESEFFYYTNINVRVSTTIEIKQV